MKRRSKKPLTFVRNAFYGRRANPVREPLKKGAGGLNDCFRPSAGASKADLAEYHAEEMGLRRAKQRKRETNVYPLRPASIATGNRHGGAHEHKREIARRLALAEQEIGGGK